MASRTTLRETKYQSRLVINGRRLAGMISSLLNPTWQLESTTLWCVRMTFEERRAHYLPSISYIGYVYTAWYKLNSNVISLRCLS